jgi:hypothetical protein
MASSKTPDMGRLASRALAPLAAVALAGLAGCGMFSAKAPQFDCPATAAVGDATVLNKFRTGPGRDLTDVQYQVRLVDVNSQCRYDSKGVDVQMRAGFALELGPANPDRNAQYEFFIAITDPNNEIVAKRNFTTPITFPGNIGYVEHLEELQQRIPLPKGGSAADYRIIVGLQLTPDELEFNRKYERR